MPTTMKLIAKNVLGSDTSSVTFSSIPGTGYTDLVLLCSSRTNRSGFSNDGINVQFNGSGSGYSTRALEGSGSAASSRSFSAMYLTQACTGATATSNTFGNAEMYIPNYAGSTNKSVSSTCVVETNAAEAFMSADASLWSNTAAITSIALTPITGPNFISGSSFFLFGISKA